MTATKLERMGALLIALPSMLDGFAARLDRPVARNHAAMGSPLGIALVQASLTRPAMMAQIIRCSVYTTPPLLARSVTPSPVIPFPAPFNIVAMETSSPIMSSATMVMRSLNRALTVNPLVRSVTAPARMGLASPPFVATMYWIPLAAKNAIMGKITPTTPSA